MPLTSPDRIPLTVLQHDRERKRKMKFYADERNQALQSEGNTVLPRQSWLTKLSTSYNPTKRTHCATVRIMRKIRKIPDGKHGAKNKKERLVRCEQRGNTERKNEK